jgi:hypothetical protein
MPTRAKRPRNANGNARRKVRAWLRCQRGPCHVCGLAIDYSLPPGHPMAFEADEVVPVSRGGSPTDPANVAAAHRCCNIWRGNRMSWNPADAPARNGGRYLPHGPRPRPGRDAAQKAQGGAASGTPTGDAPGQPSPTERPHGREGDDGDERRPTRSSRDW